MKFIKILRLIKINRFVIDKLKKNKKFILKKKNIKIT